uniref:Peptide-O-fucosyltransferase n=1 Tax=Amphimedon queenslandica TaxID=400682 RepID=A0A1X7VDR0_AMPQE
MVHVKRSVFFLALLLVLVVLLLVYSVTRASTGRQKLHLMVYFLREMDPPNSSEEVSLVDPVLLESSPQAVPPCRYVLALSYWEKMTQGVTNLLSLLRFARLWKARVVIPFVRKSSLFGLPLGQEDFWNFHDNKTLVDQELPLDLLFQLDDFKGNPQKNSRYAPMIDYGDFIKELDLQKGEEELQIFYVKIVYAQQNWISHPGTIDCSTLMKINKHWTDPNFPGVNVACCKINGALPTLPENISSLCGFKSMSSYVVIFEVWQGITRPNPDRYFRMFVPSEFFRNDTAISPVLPHSQYVIGNATEFIKHTTGTDVEYIGVHIRTEKLAINSKHIDDKKCITSAIEESKKLSVEYNISHTLYFTDGLPYNNKLRPFYRSYVRLMTARGVKRSVYDPLLFNGVDNSAFIAQVEMQVMSRATRLVVCGGGSFQYVIIQRFSKRNSNPIVRIEGCS